MVNNIQKYPLKIKENSIETFITQEIKDSLIKIIEDPLNIKDSEIEHAWKNLEIGKEQTIPLLNLNEHIGKLSIGELSYITHHLVIDTLLKTHQIDNSFLIEDPLINKVFQQHDPSYKSTREQELQNLIQQGEFDMGGKYCGVSHEAFLNDEGPIFF